MRDTRDLANLLSAARTTPARGAPSRSHAGPSNQGSPRRQAASHRQRVEAPEQPAVDARSSARRTRRARSRASVASFSARLTVVARRVERAARARCVSAARRAGSPASAPPCQTWRSTVSQTWRFGVPPSGAQAQRSRRQRERIERVLRRRLDRDAVRVGEPVHVAEGPGALRLDLGRALLAPVLQQRGEQHRPVGDLYDRPSSASGRRSNAR